MNCSRNAKFSCFSDHEKAARRPAADVILDVFGSVNARGGHVDSTIARLIAAA